MVTLLSIFYPLEMISIKSERCHCPNKVKKHLKKRKLATITFLALGDDREIKPHAREQTKFFFFFFFLNFNDTRFYNTEQYNTLQYITYNTVYLH